MTSTAAKPAAGKATAKKLFMFLVDGQVYLFRVNQNSIYASLAKVLGGKVNPSIKDRKGRKVERVTNQLPRARANFEGGGSVLFFYNPNISGEKLRNDLTKKKVSTSKGQKVISSVSFPGS